MAEYATAVVAPAFADRRRHIDRRFYIGVALFMIAFNAVAFGPSIVNPSNRNVPLPLTPLVTAHAVVSTGWLFLFLAHTTLVATGRTVVHRRLGVAGAVLTALFLVLGWFTTIEQARRGFDLSGDISRLPAPPGLDPTAGPVSLLLFFLTFGVLVGAALWYRRRRAIHNRLMLLALHGGLSPTPVAHVIGTWPALQPWANLIFPSASSRSCRSGRFTNGCLKAAYTRCHCGWDCRYSRGPRYSVSRSFRAPGGLRVRGG